MKKSSIVSLVAVAFTMTASSGAALAGKPICDRDHCYCPSDALSAQIVTAGRHQGSVQCAPDQIYYDGYQLKNVTGYWTSDGFGYICGAPWASMSNCIFQKQ